LTHDWSFIPGPHPFTGIIIFQGPTHLLNPHIPGPHPFTESPYLGEKAEKIPENFQIFPVLRYIILFHIFIEI